MLADVLQQDARLEVMGFQYSKNCSNLQKVVISGNIIPDIAMITMLKCPKLAYFEGSSQ